MHDSDFKTLEKILEKSLRNIKNNVYLGEWLIELGSHLINTGIREHHSQRSAPRWKIDIDK
jgi:hypothetical protein